MVRRLFILLVLLLPLPARAQLGPESVESFTLKNGMKFLVLEDHAIPNANLYLFWRVGSRNEGPGLTGLSHFFEHMMFNGAKKYGPKEFDRVMEEAGGSNNAWTSEDLTVYTDWFPSDALELIFELEADRIGHLALDDKMIESERGVVLSERLTSLENSRWSLLGEHVKSAAFMAHPYRWPVLGFESDIRNWKKRDLQNYFKTYYAPNNCVAVVVGDVKAKKVRELARVHFEPIPRASPPRPVHTVEPEQQGEKRVRVNKDVVAPVLMIVYHAPKARSPDYYAVDLLASILGDGRSSRLHAALVDGKQLAVEAETYFPRSIDPNLIYFWAVCKKGVKAGELEKAIDEEVERLLAKGVTEAELEKARKKMLVNHFQNLQTINGKANGLGAHEIYFGDYRKLFSAPRAYREVTREHIATAAGKYLRKTNRTVGVLAREGER